ncbi:MAG TPA: zinc-ribbon domain-containing protein [Ktedonobacterales bacterium]|nr:zinc-ribbon domain-containing protein [Ktedonobacterales bacterium]
MSNQEMARTCASCGASNTSEAQFCGRCGHELLEASAVEEDVVFQGNPDANFWQDAGVTSPSETLEPANTSSVLGEMEAAAQAPTEGIQQKRCDWCGGLNPWTVAVCESCGAHFPVPEQDEAFRRAAEERLRQEEAALDRWRQRQRRPWRRLF